MKKIIKIIKMRLLGLVGNLKVIEIVKKDYQEMQLKLEKVEMITC